MADITATSKDDYTIFTTADLANYLKIGRDRAYSLMKSSGFPSIMIGKRRIVTKQDVNEWLSRNRYKTFEL